MNNIKATAKQVKNLIQKGPYPERPARKAYDKTCDYLDILNKRIHIQQRALACQTKALSYILQRDIYVICIAGLIARDGEMTHLQPDL